jgi:hypothetical protein
LCFDSDLCDSFEINVHGGRRGDRAQALDLWWHPVASSEALDVLHQVMYPALYCRICMAIDIASNLPAFFIVDFVFADNRIYVMVTIN